MSKRIGNGFERGRLSPAKRPKLELPKPPSIGRKSSKDDDDLWGDDFLEEDFEQIDFIASQACSQEVNVSTVDLNHHEPKNIVKYGSFVQPGPSTSAGPPTTSALANGHKKPNDSTCRRPEASSNQPPIKHPRLSSDWRPPSSQKLASSEITGHIDDLPTIDQFKGSLITRSNLNSTFQSQMHSQVPHRTTDSVDLQALTGEVYYWKEKLKKTEQQAQRDKLEKEKVFQQQMTKLENDIKTVTKDRETMKTQYDLQALQLGSLMEKCKLLETNAVKLVQPSISAVYSPKNKIVRSSSVGKASKAEMSVQVDLNMGFDSELKALVHSYPLKDIPSATFEAPLPEKSVVNIKVVEKIGQKNLPILQEEETFRIFENPELVKPIVTMVDGRQLSTAFFWSDVTLMMRKTSVEINSKDSIPIINKVNQRDNSIFINKM